MATVVCRLARAGSGPRKLKKTDPLKAFTRVPFLAAAWTISSTFFSSPPDSAANLLFCATRSRLAAWLGLGAPPAGRRHTGRLAGIEGGRVVAHMTGVGVDRERWRARGARLGDLGVQTQMTQDPLNHRRLFDQGDQT